MRTLRLALSLSLFSLAVVWPTVASGEPDQAPIAADTSTFELFGTRVCVEEDVVRTEDCDVTLEPGETPIPPAPEDAKAKPVLVFGLVMWPTEPMGEDVVRWQDDPQDRLLMALQQR